MDNKTLLLDKIDNNKIFFFAGSGISYKSGMPSAGKILLKTAELFLPSGEEYKKEREKIILDENYYQIQPEVFYENLLNITNSDDALSLWKCLSPYYFKKFCLPIVPNINHLFIVDYSIKNSVPIFTTNFDCLFEEAAEELNYKYQVILPYSNEEEEIIKSYNALKNKEDTVYIFKLHGSIYIENHNSIETLHATMSSITKINFPIIEFIDKLCEDKHIVFVGYSGRDIDYFPEIKKRTLKLRPFWIDKFTNEETDNNCKYINALPISCYPDKLLKEIKPKYIRSKPEISEDILENIFTDLQNNIKKKIMFNDEDKKLLGLLSSVIGEYKFAYNLLLNLYENNSFTNEKKIILLINLSQLAHEKAKFESCGFFAKKAFKMTKHDLSLDSYAIFSLSQISEYKRMLIPHIIDFSYKINYPIYFLTFISFIINGIKIKRKIRKLKFANSNKVSDTLAINSSLEHEIRLIAILQAIAKPIINRNIIFISNYLKKCLKNKLKKIENKSRLYGYAPGIANCLKYKIRLDWKKGESLEEVHIYELLTSKTGIETALRDRAQYLFESSNHINAKKCFFEMFKSGFKGGNKLNTIKGLLGVSKCNKKLGISPLLNQYELKKLKNLMHCVEGKIWQKYLIKALNDLNNGL
ncbi:hypothetical protein D4R71_06950 [bacterium]|nr:MAG: hypothetical protein D4R71_06950 [bacterium]